MSIPADIAAEPSPDEYSPVDTAVRPSTDESSPAVDEASVDDFPAKAPVNVRPSSTTTAVDGRSLSWEEILGLNNWVDLLDPLDMSLRKWILRWGDMAQVTYDAYNHDQSSKYCGSSRYGKADILTRTFYPFASDYDVVELLYATLNGERPAVQANPEPEEAFLFSTANDAWSVQSNFQGYVAVSTDEYTKNNGGRRVIYVAWRGTETTAEWINNIKFSQTPIKPLESPKATQQAWPWLPGVDNKNAKVMLGWYNIYTMYDPNSKYGKLSARKQLLPKIKELVNKYRDDDISIVCVGHSLGGALSVLSAFDIVLQGLSKKASTEDECFPVTAVLFGSPRVGNKVFADLMNSMPNLKVLHVKNVDDIVPNVPPTYIPFVGDYVDTGVSLVLDSTVSPYLNKDSRMVKYGDLHNLQALLHTAAGWNGDGHGGFKLVVNRSVALVNKTCGYLNAEYGIPKKWWVEKNRGMVYKESTGEWVLQQDEQNHSPELPTVLIKLSALEAKTAAYKAKPMPNPNGAIANGGSAADVTAIATY